MEALRREAHRLEADLEVSIHKSQESSHALSTSCVVLPMSLLFFSAQQLRLYVPVCKQDTAGQRTGRSSGDGGEIERGFIERGCFEQIAAQPDPAHEFLGLLRNVPRAGFKRVNV